MTNQCWCGVGRGSSLDSIVFLSEVDPKKRGISLGKVGVFQPPQLGPLLGVP